MDMFNMFSSHFIQVNLTDSCIKEFLNLSQDIPTSELPQEKVKYYLNMTNSLMTRVENNSIYGNALLNINEKLVSSLVTKSNTNNSMSIFLQNLEVQFVMVYEPNPSFSYSSSQLRTNSASMDIDLIGISKNNKGSAAVAFISYTEMAKILKPRKTMSTREIMSTVVLGTFPKTTHTWFTRPVNITFKHTSELDTNDPLFCLYWEENNWVEDGCVVTLTNRTHTVCSCDHISVLALIKETIPCKAIFGTTISLHCNPVLNMSMAQGVGIVFLTLCLLTFAFCCQNLNETNKALTNLCLNLLLFHLLDLLKTPLHLFLQPPQACAVMNGIRWFFFVSSFVWMFIETVLLFLFIKKASQIRLNRQEGLNWKWLTMTGYIIPLVVVIMCALVNSKLIVNEGCWETKDIDDIFDVPILFTVSSNMTLYIIIIIMMIFTLKQLKNENLQRSNPDRTDMMMRVMFKSLAQFIILGCYGIFLYIPSKDGVLFNVFLFLNSQQGTFIFIVHCLLNQAVRQKYRKLLCDICCFKSPGNVTDFENTRETLH
ncbi:adhesion G protein-coupled receptor E1-like [Hemibagrus wyckioides]|uniref:adhesion G protein-coupled receptor E1-like n=1 Tax=Hemibagrus wyckioides TaxID=337641 RepID=UPI00266CB2A6|nr:adhesion G protein-coupled receptor E1-like [Hemibagrus wyckioides]